MLHLSSVDIISIIPVDLDVEPTFIAQPQSEITLLSKSKSDGSMRESVTGRSESSRQIFTSRSQLCWPIVAMRTYHRATYMTQDYGK